MSDNNLIFEKYLGTVNESTPFAAPDEGFGSPEKMRQHKASKGKGEAITDASGYRIGEYSRGANIDIADVTARIVAAIKSEVFTVAPRLVGGVQYQLYFPGDKNDLHDRVTGIIVRELGGSRAESGYAARIVINYILNLADTEKGKIVTKDFEGTVADAAPVIQAVQQVVQRAAGNAPAPAQPPVREYTQISLTSKYKLSGGRSRNPEVNDMYSILSREIGEGETVTGFELVNLLAIVDVDRKNAETIKLITLIKAFLSEMLQAGMIEIVAGDEVDRVEILDVNSDDYDLEDMNKEILTMRRNITQGRTEVPEIED